jgi:cytochrome c5
MQNRKLIFSSTVVLLVAAGLMSYTAGCHSSGSEPAATAATAAPRSESATVAHLMAMPEKPDKTQKKAGSELWAENCTRCHNARPPQYYSDATWDIIVHHMRLRANLTGEEARAIAEFLKAAN